MSWSAPNLAREPFVNLRPLIRLSALLSIAALGWTLWNAISYGQAGSEAAARRAELEQLTTEIEGARARIATLEADLERRDLGAENRLARFLNQKIAQRTFSWNQLFDRLAEVTPPEVRLRRLTPRSNDSTSSSRSVDLSISAEAESGEAMLEFVDRLFAHPSFEAPNLSRESRHRGGRIGFKISAVYHPEDAR